MPRPLANEITAIFHRLEARGSKVLLVMLPPGAKEGLMPGTVLRDLPVALAHRSGVLWWDLNDGLPKDAVGYTDGLHLDAESAGKVMAQIMRGRGGDKRAVARLSRAANASGSHGPSTAFEG